jgi:hypothetical protein
VACKQVINDYCYNGYFDASILGGGGNNTVGNNTIGNGTQPVTEGRINVGIIIGAVVGSLVGLSVIMLAVYFCVCKGSQNREDAARNMQAVRVQNSANDMKIKYEIGEKDELKAGITMD